MTFNYVIANKIRTNLLLFIDKEIRSKNSNINKIHKYYNNTSQIINEELVYSDTQKAKSNNLIQIQKINDIKDDDQLFEEKYCSKKVEKSLSQLLLYKKQKLSPSSSGNLNIVLGNKKYKRKSDRKLSSTMPFLIIGNNKKSAKIYLKDLCNSLISKTNFRKNIFSKKANLIKDKKSTRSIKKVKKISKVNGNNYSKNKKRNSPSSLDSFKLILFGY